MLFLETEIQPAVGLPVEQCKKIAEPFCGVRFVL